MPDALTARERAHLKARAHALEPVVHAGHAGVTDALLAEVDRALTAHELIKVKVGVDDRARRVAIGDAICARTGAAAVHRVGKILILWRPRPGDAPPDPAEQDRRATGAAARRRSPIFGAARTRRTRPSRSRS
jgi:RNA-binding protein